MTPCCVLFLIIIPCTADITRADSERCKSSDPVAPGAPTRRIPRLDRAHLTYQTMRHLVEVHHYHQAAAKGGGNGNKPARADGKTDIITPPRPVVVVGLWGIRRRVGSLTALGCLFLLPRQGAGHRNEEARCV